MAEKLCQLRKKGGGELSETALWTNSSPSATYPSQTITLSQSYTTFDKLRIYYRIATNAEDIYSIDVEKTVWDNVVTGNNKPRVVIGCINNDGTKNYSRILRHTTTTDVIISSANELGTTSNNNNFLLPQRICGLK